MRWALTIIMSLLFVFPSYASDKALVLINGLTGTREYFNQYLGEIQQHGYDPIPIDLYAHGDFGDSEQSKTLSGKLHWRLKDKLRDIQK